VEVSSCDYIGRTEEVLSRLGSSDERRADFEAGFGLKKPEATDVYGEFETNPIPVAGTRNVTWRPKALGILNCTSYLPVSLLSSPFILELTFLDDLKSGLNTSSDFGDSFSVSDMICHVDSLPVDASFLTSISQHMLSGHSLNLTYQKHANFVLRDAFAFDPDRPRSLSFATQQCYANTGEGRRCGF